MIRTRFSTAFQRETWWVAGFLGARTHRLMETVRRRKANGDDARDLIRGVSAPQLMDWDDIPDDVIRNTLLNGPGLTMIGVSFVSTPRSTNSPFAEMARRVGMLPVPLDSRLLLRPQSF